MLYESRGRRGGSDRVSKDGWISGASRARTARSRPRGYSGRREGPVRKRGGPSEPPNSGERAKRSPDPLPPTFGGRAIPYRRASAVGLWPELAAEVRRQSFMIAARERRRGP